MINIMINIIINNIIINIIINNIMINIIIINNIMVTFPLMARPTRGNKSDTILRKVVEEGLIMSREPHGKI